jgi:hypothetical protein
MIGCGWRVWGAVVVNHRVLGIRVAVATTAVGCCCGCGCLVYAGSCLMQAHSTTNLQQNVNFRLRFGLVNSIYTFFRLNICICLLEIFNLYLLEMFFFTFNLFFINF